jgi:hypothetical protein
VRSREAYCYFTRLLTTTKRREAYWTFFTFGGHHWSNEMSRGLLRDYRNGVERLIY